MRISHRLPVKGESTAAVLKTFGSSASIPDKMVRRRIFSVIFSVLLIFSCVGSVLAQEPWEAGCVCSDEGPRQLAVIVQDERGVPWALLTSAENPASWFSCVKPYDTVTVVRDAEGNAYARLTNSASSSSSCWPFTCANAQAPSLAAMTGVVAVYFVPGFGQVALLALRTIPPV